MRSWGRPARHDPCVGALVIVVVVVVSGLPPVEFRAHPSGPEILPPVLGVPGHSVRPGETVATGQSAARAATQYVISGTVEGSGRTRTPLGGLNVSLYARPCSGTATNATCAYLGHTTTASDGSFQIDAASGAYFVVANNSSRWGGAWQAVTVASGAAQASLLAYPWVLYGNTTFVLPAWNNLSMFASNCNAAYPCGSGVYGTQNPLVSWTSDGVYYVNLTSRLVYYSFANRTVRDIAPWLNLYDDLMAYQGIENTDWVTADGAFVYEFGCASDCQMSSTSPVLFYAVNTTNGQTFRHTFSGVTDADLQPNAQIQMIGEDGNSSIATLIDAAGTVLAYNIWNHTQWKIGSLDFFEANNIYWFPTLNSFLNVQADGSSSDGLEQVRLEGPVPGTKLVTVVSTTYGTNFLCNGVNGVYLNVTSHRIGVSELTGGGPIRTEFWQYDGRGLLTGNYTLVRPVTFSTWPSNSAPANIYSSEHRPTTSSDGPVYNGIWDGMFGNNSWLYEPSLGQFYASNVTQDHLGRGPALRQSGMSPASVETMFVNTSYSVISESVNCRTNGTLCPVRGTSPGTVPGTVWWTWKLGLPQLPFRGNVSGAETLPPGPMNFTNTTTSTSITVAWGPPATGAHPIVNYTLFWRAARSPTIHAFDVWAENRSERITGLVVASPYVVCLEAWNLHWHDAATCENVTTANPNGPLTVSGLSASPAKLDVGMTSRLTVNGSGGLGPFTFNYSGLPPGCVSANAATFACSPTAAGRFGVLVNVTDATGASGTARTALVVAPRFAAIPTVPTSVDVGQNLTLTYSVVGVGTPPYQATWTVAGVVYSTPAGGTGTVDVPVSSVGTVPVSFVAQDALGEAAYANARVPANPALVAQLNASPPAADVGRPVTVFATLSGGTAPRDLSFGEVPIGCVAENASQLLCRVDAAGDAVVSATASDAAQSIVFVTTNFTVNADPRIVTFAPAPGVIGPGQFVEWRLVTEFGTGALAVRASGLPPGCAASDASVNGWKCTPSAAGTFRVTVTVTDADGVSANSTATLVVRATPGTGNPGTGPLWPFELAGAVGAIAVALAAWTRRRGARRRGPPVSTRP